MAPSLRINCDLRNDGALPFAEMGFHQRLLLALT